jgi:SAM-dependent methyltransferase
MMPVDSARYPAMSIRVRRPIPPLSFSAWLRYDAVSRLLPDNARRVLEVGAGLGSVGALFADRFEYTGLEPDPISFATASQRIGDSGVVLNCAVEDLQVGQPFDVVCAFEVLEHCQDHRTALATWLRHLRPGGYAVISVPFGRDRFGAWDRRAGHFRRYDREDIVETMESAGLQSIRTIAYGFPLGSAAAAIRDAIARSRQHNSTMEERTAVSGRMLQPPEWAAGATRVIAAPFCLIQRPFANTSLGPGIIARGQLPEN